MLLKFSAVHLKFRQCAQKFTASSTSAPKLKFKLKVLLRNLESQKILLMESGIQIKESGIPITIGIQNSTVLQKNTGIQYLESGIHSVESRIQDCAGLFPYKG